MSPSAPSPSTGQRRPGLFGWLVFAPLLVWLAAFVVAPTLIVLVYSFCVRKGQSEVLFKFTWDNYHKIIDDPRLWTEPLTALLCWTIGGAIIGVLLGWIAFQSAVQRHAWFWIGAVLWGGLFAVALHLRIDDPKNLEEWKNSVLSSNFIWVIVIGLGIGGFAGFVLAEVWPVHGSPGKLMWTLGLTGGFIFALLSLHFEIFGIPRGRAVDFKLFWRAVEYALMTTGICVVAGYPVAYFIGRASDHWRNRLLLLVMIPFWTSFLIRTLAWLTILAQEGPINSLLLQLGWIDKPFSVLGTPTAVILGLVYTYLPFMILPIYGSVEKLDYSMVEAAMDLGASPIRAFAKVILPITRPGIIAGVLLVFIPSLGMYAIADLMGGDNIQTRTIGRVIEDQFIGKAGNWPYGSALGMAIMLLFAVSYGLTRKHHAQ